MSARAPESPAPLSAAAEEARGWLALCGLLAGGSVLGWWAPTALLDWQPARAAGEPWRFFTAAWVHWSEWHLTANLIGIGIVALLGAVARLPWRAALALALAWPITHAGLLWQPALAHYGGASGVLHAAVAVAACWLLIEGPGRRVRTIGVAIGAGLTIKVLLERPWAGPLASSLAWDIAVAPLAHASGALAGVAAALAAYGFRFKERGAG